ncbi:MAG: MFS transporter [Dehalococcoidia bacterium]|nr:MFS transporter [Dehalococcoidia bacterium]
MRQLTTGPLMFPSGILADFARRRTALILGGALLAFGIGYALVAQAPTYHWLLPAVCFLGIGTALWHPSAMAAISMRYPDRRASALAIHGSGASIADAISPIAIGGLLLLMGWRNMLTLMLIPAVVLGFAFWRGLDGAFRDQSGTRPTLRAYVTDVKSMLRHRIVLAIIGVTVCTSMASLITLTFFPVYLKEDLGYSIFLLGVHISLLYVMGAVSQPILGRLSDRFGRKAVLLPSLIVFGLLYLALAVAAPGIEFGLVVGAMGLFFYALATVNQAAIMDVASERVQASTMGVTSLLGQVVTLPSPILAGLVVNQWGPQGAFATSGIIVLIAALLLALIKVPRFTRPTPPTAG